MYDPHPPDCECGPHAIATPALDALKRDMVRKAFDSIRGGECNAEGCKERTHGDDVFCVTCFRRLDKPLRDELRQAREVVRRNGGRARANAEAAYKMRIVGARLWLKKNAEATK